MTDAPAEDVVTLKNDLRKLQNDWDALVVSTQKVLREGTRTGMKEAKAEIAALRERLGNLPGIVSERSQQAAQSVRSNVEKQPLISLGVAFSVGAILAMLLAGRR